MSLSTLILLCVGVQAVLSDDVVKRDPKSVCAKVNPLLTTSNGAPVDDKTSTMSAGPDGPVVLQDFVLLDELSHFNRERIPERIGHPKGTGAHGVFTVTKTDFTKYCKASLFDTVGKQTEFAVRFSTSNMESGSCDTVRDTRGGAFKFYTTDGNWDLVGNNYHTFWIRDPLLFANLAHAIRRNPSSHLLDANAFWDFMSLRPETLHHMIRTLSDQGTTDGYRFTSYYGSNTFKTVNKEGEAFYVKFHMLSDQGEKNLTAAEAAQKCATDPDYSTRDLFESIEKKDFPSWTMYFQVMTFEQAEKFRWNPFDVTKFWPRSEYPIIEIGKILVNRNPTNWFAEVEQAGFSPSHMVPGIEPSPDKMLQARLFAYPDAQRYRLGPNYQQLPINRPRVAVQNNQRDGPMCYYNQGAAVNYYPNSIGGSVQPCPAAAVAKYNVSGDVQRYNTRDEDNYSQPAMFYNAFDDMQRAALISNLSGSLKHAKIETQKRMVSELMKVDKKFGERVAAAMELKM